jgi:hypothetical protein
MRSRRRFRPMQGSLKSKPVRTEKGWPHQQFARHFSMLSRIHQARAFRGTAFACLGRSTPYDLSYLAAINEMRTLVVVALICTVAVSSTLQFNALSVPHEGSRKAVSQHSDACPFHPGSEVVVRGVALYRSLFNVVRALSAKCLTLNTSRQQSLLACSLAISARASLGIFSLHSLSIKFQI